MIVTKNDSIFLVAVNLQQLKLNGPRLYQIIFQWDSRNSISFMKVDTSASRIKLHFHINGKRSDRERERTTSSQDPSLLYMCEWSRMEDTLFRKLILFPLVSFKPQTPATLVIYITFTPIILQSRR